LLDSFAKGVVLGLSLAAPPGPINAVIAARSVVSRALGASVGFGALTSDMIFLTLTLCLGSIIPESLVPYVGLAGTALLLYLGSMILTSTLRKGCHTKQSVEAKGEVESLDVLRSYLTGLVMGLSNPFQISWWITVGLTLIAEFGLLIALGFVFGIALWVVSFSYAISVGKDVPKLRSAITIASGILLLLFAGYLALYSVERIL